MVLMAITDIDPHTFFEDPAFGAEEFQARLAHIEFFGPHEVTVEQPRSDLLLEDCSIEDALPPEVVTEVFVARERGYCGGVRATLLGLSALQGANEVPVKVNERPTHGADSNNEFRRMGVQMEVPLEEIQDGDVVYISAHGAPQYLQVATKKGAEVYDGTCIFVDATHTEIRMAARAAEQDGVTTGLVYLSLSGRGDHPELRGSVGYAESLGLEVVVVKEEDEIAALTSPEGPMAMWDRVRIISQTTNDANRAEAAAAAVTEAIEESGLSVDTTTHPFNKTDVCRTVTDRQNAIIEMVQEKDVETMIIIGSLHSKNTINLKKVALSAAQQAFEQGGRPSLQRIILVNSHGQLPRDIRGRVGVTSGASTDDRNVDALLAFLNHPVTAEVGQSDKDRLSGVFPPVRRGPHQKELTRLIRGNTTSL